MANLKYKDENNAWTSILLTRGMTGPQGTPGKDAEITLNGEVKRSASFYAPVNSGQAGQILASNGAGVAPSYIEPPLVVQNVDNLTIGSHDYRKVLSAHQGYILNQNKVEKSTTIAGLNLQDNVSANALKSALGIKREILTYETTTVPVTTSTDNTLIFTVPIANEGLYMLTGSILLNNYGSQTGRDMVLRVYLNETIIFTAHRVINSEIYRMSEPIVAPFIASPGDLLRVRAQSLVAKQWSCAASDVKITYIC